MKTFPRFIAALYMVLAVAGCSVVKNEEDPEKDIRSFLAAFQTSLSGPDDEILARFRAQQSRDALLSVIRILQNKDPFIVCDADFSNAAINTEGELIMVGIPVTFSVKDLRSEGTKSMLLNFSLKRSGDTFEITDLNGESFYQEFFVIKNGSQWEADQKLALQERLWIYENARTLEAKFDSVIWYTAIGQENYFYVVEGHWENYFLDYKTRNQRSQVRMGLADSKGELIIPIEYDLIGTISFSRNNVVEVIKDGKVGCFNIETRQLIVQPQYDFIIPYWSNNSWALVKQDTAYGWLDESFRYTAGFPSKRAQDFVMNFEFLKESVHLQAGKYNFCEIPSPDYTGNGIIIPPAYFTRHGIFDVIEGGISTTKVPLNAWTEYKETKSSFLEKVSDNLRAVVTTIQERYLEGREEFYTSNTLVFVNNKQDTLKVASISGSEVSIRAINPNLLEVRAPRDYWFGEYEASEENNLEEHTYFSVSAENAVQALPSNRLYAQTQYVKLDSSYLTGRFMVYNRQSEGEEPKTFLSALTITYMRDEILASYGYQFPSEERTEKFKNTGNWYEPKYTNAADAEADMTEIDKHNLAFLNKVLSLMEVQKPA